MQKRLMQELYEEVGVNPLDVAYIEAHGTGTKAGDPTELAALADIFCIGRKGPLLVGSVKSNMGHAEPASGLCSIAKVLMARLAGVLPPNLHFNSPNPECTALLDGRIHVVTEPTAFDAEFVGINSFGIGGTNAHVILQFENTKIGCTTPIDNCEASLHDDDKISVIGLGNKTYRLKLKFERGEKKSEKIIAPCSIPIMILASGRTIESVEHFLKKASIHFENQEFVGLLHEVARTQIPQNQYLGYVISDHGIASEPIARGKQGLSQMLWFIFSGQGSQWIGMSKDMMRFKKFSSSIHLSAKILSNNQIDLIALLETLNIDILNDVVNTYVVVTAFQIGLLDLITSLEVLPDGMIGHSLGEIACAYADGCLTHEQALLSSFCKAYACTESDLPEGTLASVGLSWEEAKNRCPSDVFPVIHNAANNVTIAGPTDSVCKFLDALASEGCFAKRVQSAKYAFHAPSMQKCEKLLTNMIKSVIPEPKRRSSKWLSTSIPVSDWDTGLAQFCSAEYFANNSTSPVYLFETLQHIREKSIVLEIAPHCFLQSFLKQTLKDMEVFGVMHCMQRDNAVFFLNAIGNLFMAGVKVNISLLYDPVKFPVSFKTPSISSMIKWDHSSTWEVPHYKNEMSSGNSTKITIALSTDDALAGHKIHDKVVFPATGYIWLAWKALAKQENVNFETLPVRLEDVRFKRMTELQRDVSVEFHVNILKKIGIFEITESDEVVCNGTIQYARNAANETFTNVACVKKLTDVLEKEDIYTFLSLKGYGYQGIFQGIHKVSIEEQWAELEWKDNWVSFMDTMLQTLILDEPLKELIVPVRLESVMIDPVAFTENLDATTKLVEANRCKYLSTVQCNGIQMRGLTPSTIPPTTKVLTPTITIQKFCPYFGHEAVSLQEAVEFFIGIVVDNSFPAFHKYFVLTEMLQKTKSVHINLAAHLFIKFFSYEHRIVRPADANGSKSESHSGPYRNIEHISELNTLPRSTVLWTDQETIQEIPNYKDLLMDNGFLILNASHESISSDLALIAEKRTGSNSIYLLRKIPSLVAIATLVTIDLPDFRWVEIMKEKIQSLPEGHKLYVVSMSETSGIIGFIKCLLRDPECQNIRCIHAPTSLSFDPKDVLTRDDIFQKDLVYNVYKNGMWGAYAHFTLHDVDAQRNCEQVRAHVSTIGDLSSLCWVENTCGLDETDRYRIHFAGLNFRDVMFATGRLSKCAFPEETQRKERFLGLEFSGTYKGQRVCGFSGGNCLASVLDHKPSLIYTVPDQWSLAEAATVPSVYSAALYALIIRGRLKNGETVLIHSGSGGVGIAAITIAFQMNCKVFTSVGSNDKREFLKGIFSKLQDDDILDSKEAKCFEESILRRTKGRGVDVVLNSLAQEKLQASVRCLGKGGRFLEIGKFDIFNNASVGMAVLLKNVNIQGVHLDQVCETDPNATAEIQELVQRYIDEGKVKPLPFTIFTYDKLGDAFRYLVSRKHVGKVIVQMRENSMPASILASPRTFFDPIKTYVILGGLGGMGLEILDWMIERGARKLFIVSRSGITTSYQNHMVTKWRQSGASIFLRNTDISSRPDVFKLWQDVIVEGPPGGFFNLAIVLHDAIFVNQSSQTFASVSNCKAAATMHFDCVSRLYSPNLDHFVVFSSVTSGKGNPGQTNYGYGNSAMERICEQRKSDGLVALAIQWGPVAQVGSMGKLFPARTNTLVGVPAQSIASCISTFDSLLQQEQTVVSSFVLAEGNDIDTDTKEATLAQTVAGILGIQDIKKVDVNATLTELGMDSIMSAQVKHAIQTKESIFLPSSEYGNVTFKYLLGLDV